MFLVNSRLGLFTAAIFRWHPFSRSYGVILPSSLTIVLSLTLGSSPHLPVSVYGTGTFSLSRGFSLQRGLFCFCTCFPSPSHFTLKKQRICLLLQTLCLDALFQPRAQILLLCPPFDQTGVGGTGLSTCCPSPTALALGLGPDLP